MPARANSARVAIFPNRKSLQQTDPKFIRSSTIAALESKTAELRSAGQPRAAVPTRFLPMPQAFYRRKLPHLQVDDKPHFVTFCTYQRWILPQSVRSIVLECCLHDNGENFDLKAAVVMPDHVHMIFTPLIDYRAMEVWPLARIMDSIKGASAHKINRALGRMGRVWQTESFDHVLRSSETLDGKIRYVLENPVRKGLVRGWSEYPWLWQKKFVNPFSP